MSEEQKRTCANCACKSEQKNEVNGEIQLFCRRDMAIATPVRLERPRLINGEITIDRKTQKPVMENYQDIAYLYRPTMQNLVCFDGWRPEGTLPGEKSLDKETSVAIKLAVDAIKTGISALVGTPFEKLASPFDH